MAIAFDAVAQGAAIDVSASWTHTPVGTPRGILVGVYTGVINGATPVSATYGGVAMSRVGTSIGTGETFAVATFFLGSGIPTGAQTVVATASELSFVQGVSTSLTASNNTTVFSTGTINSASVSNPSVPLPLGTRLCFAQLNLISGQDDPLNVAPLTGWTAQVTGNPAATATTALYTYDVIGRTDVTAGWTQAADDAVAVAVAVSENFPSLSLLGVGT